MKNKNSQVKNEKKSINERIDELMKICRRLSAVQIFLCNSTTLNLWIGHVIRMPD